METFNKKRICLWQGKRLKKEECLCTSKDTFVCECKEFTKDKTCIPFKDYPTCKQFIEELL